MELAGYAIRSCSRFAQEGHGDGGDPFAAAYGADPLVGRGLDVDPDRVQPQRLADRLPHLRQVRRQLRPLRDERGVHVPRPVPGLLHRGADLSEEAAAVGPRVGRVVRRVALADVPQAGGAEEGVDDGVEEDVGVAVAAEAGLAGYRHASQDEGALFLKAGYIISDADSHVDSLRSV